MATSATAIANRALQKLGARRVDSLDQDHANARAMKAAFAPVRDRLLRQYAWSFAIQRAQVPADAAETTWGGLTRFPKPADFLRLLRGKESGTDNQEGYRNWQIEGDYIVTNAAAPLEFRYVARVTNPNKFDPLFAELLAATLAVEVTGEIPVSATDKNLLQREQRDRLREARQVDSMENPSPEPPKDEWLQARL